MKNIIFHCTVFLHVVMEDEENIAPNDQFDESRLNLSSCQELIEVRSNEGENDATRIKTSK